MASKIFENDFKRPDTDSHKNALSSVELLIKPEDIALKTRLIDPNSMTALELIMFDMAGEAPSARQLMLLESMTSEGWAHTEAEGWVADAKSTASKQWEAAMQAEDKGGRYLQVQLLELTYHMLGLMKKEEHLAEGYVIGPHDYMFMWTNLKKFNNVSWNGKGRIEFLQGIMGSYLLQNERNQDLMNRITNQ